MPRNPPTSKSALEPEADTFPNPRPGDALLIYRLSLDEPPRARPAPLGPDELKNIKHRKDYEAGLDHLPDYRLTCFFVDTRYQRGGLTSSATCQESSPSRRTNPRNGMQRERRSQGRGVSAALAA